MQLLLGAGEGALQGKQCPQGDPGSGWSKKSKITIQEKMEDLEDFWVMHSTYRRSQ